MATPIARSFRLVLGGMRVYGERINNRLHVRFCTDRKVPEGMTRGPSVSFDLDPRDSLAFALALHTQASTILSSLEPVAGGAA